MKILKFAGLIATFTLAVSSARAEAPTLEQTNAALTAAKVGGPKITKILGCLPAFERAADTWVCPLMGNGDDEPRSFTFVQKNGSWQVLPEDDAEPACPSTKQAEELLQSVKKDSSLRVTGNVDEGRGTITDKRGQNHSTKGPYRNMCRYTVTTPPNSKWLYVSYMWHENGRYVIDQDLEISPD